MRDLRITQSTPFVSVGKIFRKVRLLPAVLLLFFLSVGFVGNVDDIPYRNVDG